jgi:hypothetical protein
MQDAKITVDYKRAVEVAKLAVGMLEKKVWPFSIPDLFPDAIVPDGIEKGSLNHARYLLYAVSLDRGRDSKTVYKKCRLMATKLDFSELPNLKEGYIRWFLERNFEKPKNPNRTFGDPVKTWVENSSRLNEKYNNDPRSIRGETVEETVKRIQEFYGYGKQTPWLLFKNYIKAGIWNFPLDQINIKIDRHATKISLGTGVIKIEGAEEIRCDQLVPQLSEVYRKVIKQEGISPIDLNDSFWAIGQYKCDLNNALYCICNCNIGCTARYWTDKKFTIIRLDGDSRRNADNLFS